MQSNPPKVFISYTHDSAEHKERVLALADRLCADGVDAHLDQYETSPSVPWPRWMENQIEGADFVLVVVTETYARRYLGHEEPDRGHGGQWEGAIITQTLYDDAVRNTKFIPVVFHHDDTAHIPRLLRGFNWYVVDIDDGYLKLYRRLTDQPEVKKPPVGQQRVLPTRRPASSPSIEPQVEISMPLGTEKTSVTPAVQPRAAPAKLEIQAPVDFVIVTALEEERDAVLRQLQSYHQLPPTDDDVRVYFASELPVSFSDGTSGVYSVVVLPLLGMGRVDAANATSDAIRRWQPRYLLLVGIAGGISDKGIGLGDVLISDRVVDYELQKITEEGSQVRYSVHPADARLLGAAQNFLADDWLARVSLERPVRGKPRRVIGPIATGDKVVAFADVLRRYSEDWPKLIGVEMEAGGAASACHQAAQRPGFFMVRAVSDLADQEKGSEKVESWRPYVCEVAAAYAVALLQSGPVVLRDPR